MPATDRLVKAKSDGSLASTGTAGCSESSRLRSRSLEPLTGLAMWSSHPQLIELMKGERGLGFSILDYQVYFSKYYCHLVFYFLCKIILFAGSYEPQ